MPCCRSPRPVPFAVALLAVLALAAPPARAETPPHTPPGLLACSGGIGPAWQCLVAVWRETASTWLSTISGAGWQSLPAKGRRAPAAGPRGASELSLVIPIPPANPGSGDTSGTPQAPLPVPNPQPQPLPESGGYTDPDGI